MKGCGWFVGFILVDFKDEEGHTVTATYPPRCCTDTQLKRIQRLAIPESYPLPPSAAANENARPRGENGSPEFSFSTKLRFDVPSDVGQLWGFAAFGMLKLSPRGSRRANYMQRAGVVISENLAPEIFCTFAEKIRDASIYSDLPPAELLKRIWDAVGRLWGSALPRPPGCLLSLKCDDMSLPFSFCEFCPGLIFHAEMGDAEAESDADFYSADEGDSADEQSRAEWLGEVRSVEIGLPPRFLDGRYCQHLPELALAVILKPLRGMLLCLWESRIVARATLVVGADPNWVSQVVLALSSLIAPLRLQGYCKPHVTAFDADFPNWRSTIHCNRSLAGQKILPQRRESVLLGCTNPVVVQDLTPVLGEVVGLDLPQEWLPKRIRKAHRIQICRNVREPSGWSFQPQDVKDSIFRDSRFPQQLSWIFPAASKGESLTESFVDTTYLDGASTKPSLLFAGGERIFNHKDCARFNSSLRGNVGGDPLLEDLFIRDVLCVTTNDFLRPLSEALKDLSNHCCDNGPPFRSMVWLRPFQPDEVLCRLKPHGFFATLTPRQLHKLYRQFFSTMTFELWLAKERRHLETEKKRCQLNLCLQTTVSDFTLWTDSELLSSIQFAQNLVKGTEKGYEGLISPRQAKMFAHHIILLRTEIRSRFGEGSPGKTSPGGIRFVPQMEIAISGREVRVAWHPQTRGKVEVDLASTLKVAVKLSLSTSSCATAAPNNVSQTAKDSPCKRKRCDDVLDITSSGLLTPSGCTTSCEGCFDLRNVYVVPEGTLGADYMAPQWCNRTVTESTILGDQQQRLYCQEIDSYCGSTASCRTHYRDRSYVAIDIRR